MNAIITSREFNQHASKAQKAAEQAPVFITRHGKMVNVLLSYEAYQRLSQQPRSILETLADPDPAAADIEFSPERPEGSLRPIEF